MHQKIPSLGATLANCIFILLLLLINSECLCSSTGNGALSNDVVGQRIWKHQNLTQAHRWGQCGHPT